MKKNKDYEELLKKGTITKKVTIEPPPSPVTLQNDVQKLFTEAKNHASGYRRRAHIILVKE